MIKGYLIAAVLLTLSTSLLAEVKNAHECERYGIRRTVELVVADASGVPCKVVYSRPMEDQSVDTLWNAKNDAGFCVKKYDSFIVKLETRLNWSCTASSGNENDTSANLPGSTITKPDTELTREFAGSSATSPEAAPAAPEALAAPEIKAVSGEPVSMTTEGIKAYPEPDGNSSNLNPNPVTDGKTPAESEPGSLLQTTPSASNEQNDRSIQELMPDEQKVEDDLPSEPLLEQQLPILSAALPENLSNEASRPVINLETLRIHFPSGYYSTSPDIPHSGNVAMCPTGGFFIWNTQQPGKPAFEMGSDAVFIFNLRQFSDSTRAVSTGAARAARCDFDIRSTYCLDNKLEGEDSAARSIATSLGCRQLNTSGTPLRALTLVSTLSEPVSGNCASDAPATDMGLASLPAAATGENEGYSGEGFEVLISERLNASDSWANCRYVRGR